MSLIYGLHAVTAVLNNRPKDITHLWVLEGRHDQRMQQLRTLAQQQRIVIEMKSRQELDQCAQGEVHQGVIAFVQTTLTYGEADLPALLAAAVPAPLILALDGIADPHNLGACLRTADAAGVCAVIAPKDRAVALTPVVRKVACGAAETVPFIGVTNLVRTLQSLKEQGCWIVGLAGEAEQSLFEVDLGGPLVMVLGAEGDGLRRLTKEHCDFLAKIPMAGSVSSLNVSVATGISLFEAVRQRAKQT